MESSGISSIRVRELNLTPSVGIMKFLFEFFFLWYIVYYHDKYLSQKFLSSWNKILKSYGMSRYNGYYVITVTNSNISRKTQAFKF